MNELQGFLLEQEGIRGALVRLNETWTQIVSEHRYPSTVRGVLGEGVAATVLLASGLKGKPSVSMQLQGNGPLSLLVVQCSRELRVRGMAQWHDHNENVTLIGEGRLAVTLDTGESQGIFQGIVPLVGSGIDGCLEAYFGQSEQLPTRLVLSADEPTAAGLLLQSLPGHESSTEKFETAAALAKAVEPAALMQEPAATLLPALFPNHMIRLFDARPVLHDCRCTPEHLAGIARMLGADELRGILAERGNVELTCEFCNRAFRYDADDIETIVRGETPAAALH